MDLRAHIASEASAFADRIAAAVESAIEETKRESQTALDSLRVSADAVRAELEAETTRTAALTAALDAALADAAATSSLLEAESAQMALQRQAHETIVADLQSQLEARLDMARATEAGLTAALQAMREQAEAAAADVETLREQVRTSAVDAESLRTQLASTIADADAVRQHAASVAAELDALRTAAASQSTELEALRPLAASQTEELESLRAASAAHTVELESLRAASAAQTAELESLRTGSASLTAALDSLRAEASAAAGEADATRQQLLAVIAERDALRAQAGTLQDELQTVRARADADAERAAHLDDTNAALAALQTELEEAQAIADAASAEMTAARERTRKATALLASTASALGALDLESTIAGVFATLVRQLRPEFSRTAVFRVKGGHLEGEVAAGVDDSVDVTKIVIPKGLDSLITTAAAGSGVQVAGTDGIAEAHPPFGGTPVSALAAPLVFEGETIAVLYADADAAFTDAHLPLASVLVRHVTARLALLGQELKVAKGLRDYARTLLHELAEMFAADLSAGTTPNDRLRRLRESLGFARDLYAQRAALEAPTAANILEEEISALVDTDAHTPFARELASLVIESRGAARNAS